MIIVNIKGNKAANYPIGLLMTDEVVYVGIRSILDDCYYDDKVDNSFYLDYVAVNVQNHLMFPSSYTWVEECKKGSRLVGRMCLPLVVQVATLEAFPYIIKTN